MATLIENQHLTQEANAQTGASLFEFNFNKNSKKSDQLTHLEQNIYLDPFDEDETEQKFLSSKPTCFLVIGKPGVGKTTLAKKLAQEWKAELINPTELIIQNVKQATELGKKASEILIRGEAVPENMVAKMIDEKVNSPEVAHHGYVLDGFPSQSDSNFDIGKQMELLKNWKLKPDFIINLRITDNDLSKRRVTQKVDPISGNVYVKDVYAPDRSRYKKEKKKEEAKGDAEGEEEEEAEENTEEEEEEIVDEFFAPIATDVVERLVVRPEDTPSQVEISIKSFKEALLHVLEDQMANMDQSFLIEMDANLSPTILLKEMLQRLETYPIRKAAKPMRISDVPAHSEEMAEEALAEESNFQASDNFVDIAESEESLNALLGKRRLGSKFKWRRSKCSVYCPVSLKDGKIINGRGEFGASFLDKVYLMADENCLRKFLKNPRLYLQHPQPRAPCKLSILGPKYSGKTSLAGLLAKKYNAKVIDMKTLMEPKMKKARDDLIEKTKQETIENTTEQIKIKFKEKVEQDRIRREQAKLEREAAAAAAEAEALEAKAQLENENQTPSNENPEAEQPKSSESEDATKEADIKEEEKEEIEDTIREEKPEIEEKKEEPEEDPRTYLNEKSVYLNDEGEIIVELDHPEITAAIERVIEQLKTQAISLPPMDYIEVLQEELDKLRKERAKIDPTSPNDGGWILDNFPSDAEQLKAMNESNIMPDTFIVLNDSSDDSNVLMRRWYSENRAEVDQRIAHRLAEEEAARLEEQRKEEEIKKARQMEFQESELEAASAVAAASADKEANADSKTTEGSATTGDDSEKTNDENGEDANLKRDTALEKIMEEDETKDANALYHKIHSAPGAGVFAATAALIGKMENQSNSSLSSVQPPTQAENILPLKGPETQEFLDSVRKTMDQIRNIQSTVGNLTGGEPALIEINRKSPYSDLDDERALDECVQEATSVAEKIFKYHAIEFDGIEEGEEAEEGEEEMGEEAEEEEAEEDVDEEDEDNNFDPTLKEKKITFGETCHYCPVTLHKKGILMPGSIECQAKYRERLYRFANDEAKQLFLENPTAFLPDPKKKAQTPPPRMLILGPRGSGKSVQARQLADKLDLFHIKFRDYLQEMIIGKTKKRIEPEREEDKELIEEEEDEDEKDDDELKDKPVKVEEPLPELTDKEETIKAYLERDEALTNEIMDEVLLQFWNEEPFKSRGFVLDGFPNNENQAQYMIEKGLFPDAVIILKMEDEEIIKRLLAPRFKEWKEKMNAKKERKQQKIAKKKEKLAKEMKTRREEEIAKYEERRRQREAEAAENEEEFEEEEFDVEAIIQDEFQDRMIEEEELEQVQDDEIKDNMTNDLRNHYEKETNSIDLTKDILQEALIPRFSIAANRKPNIVQYLIRKRLKRFIDFRQSLLERVYPIKYKLANKLIDFGYKQLSRFGRWCPVKLSKGIPIQQFYETIKRPFAVIHRSYVYFLSSKEARQEFMDDPIKYLKQPSPMQLVPFRLSIIGPPKSGKTALANRFVKEFGCVRLSAGEAIRSILENQPYSELAENINSHLIKGKTVPDELTIECIELAILNYRCQLFGYVLDNFPVTKQQVKLMTDRCLIPVKVIELKCELKEIMHRCIKDRTSSERLASGLILNDSPEIIGYKMREWKAEIAFIRDWYKNEHKNLIELDGLDSKWSLWEQTKKIGFDSIRNIQLYLDRISHQQAASIAKLCVTYDEMMSRLSDFGQYCPVSLALYDDLVDCSERRSMEFVAEYQGYYYKMFSDKELNIFLENPQKFVPPKAPRKLPVPALLPKKRTAAEVKELFPKPIELNGYCPVTYYDGKLRYEALMQGYPEYAAEYKGKLYFAENADKLEKFMRKPDLYSSLKLPHKLPPVKNPMSVINLPMTGYLEQTVADILIKSLTELGNYKPKFPFLSPTRSALLYLAYYLKAYNPKSSEFRRKKYKQKLIYFEQKCELIEYLHKNTTIKYKDPTKRTVEYNVKLESFFALRENVPTMNWLS